MQPKALLTVSVLLAVPAFVIAMPRLFPAGEFDVPHVFEAGTRARAADVNENFSAVSSGMSELAQRIDDTTYTAGDGLQLVDTTLSIASEGVTGSHIANGAVASAHIVNGSVTSFDIADGSITGTDLATDPDSLARVSGGTLFVSGSNVGAGTNTPNHPLDAASDETTAVRGVYSGGLAEAGVHGEASDSHAFGLRGVSTATSGPGTNTGAGVIGEAAHTFVPGVLGVNTADQGAGVRGVATAERGFGVAGFAEGGARWGVYAQNNSPADTLTPLYGMGTDCTRGQPGHGPSMPTLLVSRPA